MLRGLYMATSGMDVLQTCIDGTANDIANATTPGYKKDTYLIRSFPEMLMIEKGGPQNEKSSLPQKTRRIGTTGIGARLAEVSTDFTTGIIRETGNKTDILLKGPGFFAVDASGQGEPGRVGYTRNGAFKIDEEGYLTTAGGYRVLGENGEISLGDAELKFDVESDGSITVDGVRVERLRLAEFSSLDSLYKESDDIFIDRDGAAETASATTVKQGFLEGSNVNLVDEMVSLIKVTRAYEANQRMIQSQDELLAKAVNEVGSLR